MRVLEIVYPELPPSSNHIYFRGTILTKVARAYAEQFAMYFAKNYLHLVQEMDRNAVYALHLRFYFPTLVNETFQNPYVSPSKRAKTRYKKMDLSNRVKLIEDCIRDAVGVDDSQTFAASQMKLMDPMKPRVEADIDQIDPDYFGVPPLAQGAMFQRGRRR